MFGWRTKSRDLSRRPLVRRYVVSNCPHLFSSSVSAALIGIRLLETPLLLLSVLHLFCDISIISSDFQSFYHRAVFLKSCHIKNALENNSTKTRLSDQVKIFWKAEEEEGQKEEEGEKKKKT